MMNKQEYLERLERALNVNITFDTVEYWDQQEIIEEAAEHLAAILRAEIAGECKFVPCKATSDMMDVVTGMMYSQYETTRIYNHAQYKAAIQAAPPMLDEIIVKCGN